MSKSTAGTRINRAARLGWVPLDEVAVSSLAQRDMNQARVDRIVANFDPEQIGTPTVNHRDGTYYVIDGQHRIEALRQIVGEGRSIQCWIYDGLTEAEEAEKFLKLNDVLAVNSFDKFRVGVQAGRLEETDVDRIVRAVGLVISRDQVPNGVRAVGTLLRIYRRSGAAVLSRTLRVIRDAYGDFSYDAAVIDGMGLFFHRYPKVDDQRVITRLSATRGGTNNLLQRASNLRLQTGNAKGHCVAAAIVDTINAGRGGNKLPGWWSVDNPLTVLDDTAA